MRTREEQREERQQYENDVFYDVWRSGGNPDRIDCERVSDSYYDGMSHDAAANVELRRQQPKPELPSEEEWQEAQEQG